jgi:NhaP-type Na+/H+ or K+/H+ antiporter
VLFQILLAGVVAGGAAVGFALGYVVSRITERIDDPQIEITLTTNCCPRQLSTRVQPASGPLALSLDSTFPYRDRKLDLTFGVVVFSILAQVSQSSPFLESSASRKVAPQPNAEREYCYPRLHSAPGGPLPRKHSKAAAFGLNQCTSFMWLLEPRGGVSSGSDLATTT